MRQSQENRHKYFVNSQLQGAVLWQALSFWCFGFGIFTFVMFAFRIVPGWLSEDRVTFSSVGYHLAPALVASAALLPVILWRAVRFSHRFVGPMTRLQHAVQRLADGDSIETIQLRAGDFWGNFADAINRLSGRIAQGSSRETVDEESDEITADHPAREYAQPVA